MNAFWRSERGRFSCSFVFIGQTSLQEIVVRSRRGSAVASQRFRRRLDVLDADTRDRNGAAVGAAVVHFLCEHAEVLAELDERGKLVLKLDFRDFHLAGIVAGAFEIT